MTTMPMTTDLMMLVWSAVLTFVLVLPYTTGQILGGGLVDAVGNRENLPASTGWIGRAKRAHFNMLESLPLFAILVLVAHVTGRHDSLTALGATIFFWARVAHAIIYIAGIPWLRTIVWTISIVGLALILVRVL